MIERKKLWERELWIVNDEYSGKILELKKGYRCSMHYHKKKKETFFLLEGLIIMEVGDEAKIMNPENIQHINPYQKHRFNGLEDSKIIEFSRYHEEEDSYRDTMSEKIEDLTKLIKLNLEKELKNSN